MKLAGVLHSAIVRNNKPHSTYQNSNLPARLTSILYLLGLYLYLSQLNLGQSIALLLCCKRYNRMRHKIQNGAAWEMADTPVGLSIITNHFPFI